jgi:hypothetical protein
MQAPHTKDHAVVAFTSLALSPHHFLKLANYRSITESSTSDAGSNYCRFKLSLTSISLNDITGSSPGAEKEEKSPRT